MENKSPQIKKIMSLILGDSTAPKGGQQTEQGHSGLNEFRAAGTG